MTLIIKLIPFVIFLSSGFTHQQTLNQKMNEKSLLNVKNLSKKWNLEKYKYLIFSEAPSQKEQGDFILFREDMTFESVSEGIPESGKWILDIAKKRIYLSKNDEDGSLDFIVENISATQLILIIDDPSDEESKNLKIYFKL